MLSLIWLRLSGLNPNLDIYFPTVHHWTPHLETKQDKKNQLGNVLFPKHCFCTTASIPLFLPVLCVKCNRFHMSLLPPGRFCTVPCSQWQWHRGGNVVRYTHSERFSLTSLPKRVALSLCPILTSPAALFFLLAFIDIKHATHLLTYIHILRVYYLSSAFKVLKS